MPLSDTKSTAVASDGAWTIPPDEIQDESTNEVTLEMLSQLNRMLKVKKGSNKHRIISKLLKEVTDLQMSVNQQSKTHQALSARNSDIQKRTAKAMQLLVSEMTEHTVMEQELSTLRKVKEETEGRLKRERRVSVKLKRRQSLEHSLIKERDAQIVKLTQQIGILKMENKEIQSSLKKSETEAMRKEEVTKQQYLELDQLKQHQKWKGSNKELVSKCNVSEQKARDFVNQLREQEKAFSNVMQSFQSGRNDLDQKHKKEIQKMEREIRDSNSTKKKLVERIADLTFTLNSKDQEYAHRIQELEDKNHDLTNQVKASQQSAISFDKQTEEIHKEYRERIDVIEHEHKLQIQMMETQIREGNIQQQHLQEKIVDLTQVFKMELRTNQKSFEQTMQKADVQRVHDLKDEMRELKKQVSALEEAALSFHEQKMEIHKEYMERIDIMRLGHEDVIRKLEKQIQDGDVEKMEMEEKVLHLNQDTKDQWELHKKSIIRAQQSFQLAIEDIHKKHDQERQQMEGEIQDLRNLQGSFDKLVEKYHGGKGMMNGAYAGKIRVMVHEHNKEIEEREKLFRKEKHELQKELKGVTVAMRESENQLQAQNALFGEEKDKIHKEYAHRIKEMEEEIGDMQKLVKSFGQIVKENAEPIQIMEQKLKHKEGHKRVNDKIRHLEDGVKSTKCMTFDMMHAIENQYTEKRKEMEEELRNLREGSEKMQRKQVEYKLKVQNVRKQVQDLHSIQTTDSERGDEDTSCEKMMKVFRNTTHKTNEKHILRNLQMETQHAFEREKARLEHEIKDLMELLNGLEHKSQSTAELQEQLNELME